MGDSEEDLGDCGGGDDDEVLTNDYEDDDVDVPVIMKVEQKQLDVVFKTPRSDGTFGFVNASNVGPTSCRILTFGEKCQLSSSQIEFTPIRLCGGVDHSVVLSEGGRVYSWGGNSYGQLGIGNSNYSDSINLVESIKDLRIASVSCGNHHTVALTSDGKVYSWGAGELGQLGHSITKICLIPQVVSSLVSERIMSVSCGAAHTAVITEKRQIITWGSNERGQLGHNEKEPSVVRDLLDKRIAKVSCGDYYTVALTEDGQVYSWGEGGDGQLGYTPSSPPIQHKPSPITSLENRAVRYIWCGSKHTCVVTQDGKLWTFGCGEDGQLGNGSNDNELEPKIVAALEKHEVERVLSGASHTIAITEGNKIYTWGDNSNGTLGHPDTHSIYVPKLVRRLEDYQIVCTGTGKFHWMVAVN